MLTNEVIEVHLASLRAGQEELREDVRELRAKIDGVDDKVEAVNADLGKRIEAVNAELGKRIEAVNQNLGEKIARLSDAVAGMRGMQKAMLWLIGIFGSLGTVGKFLHWF